MTFNGKTVLGGFLVVLWIVLTALSTLLPNTPPELPLVAGGITGALFGLPGAVLVLLGRRGVIKQEIKSRVGKRFSPSAFVVGIGSALVGAILVGLGVSGVEIGGVTLRVLPVFGLLVAFGGFVGAGRAFAHVCIRCDEPLESSRLALARRDRDLERVIRVNDVPAVARALAPAVRVTETQAALGPRAGRFYGDAAWCARCGGVAHLRFGDAARWFFDKEASPVVTALGETRSST